MALTAVTALFFAAWATTHVYACWAVARHSLWRGCLCFVVPLLVPLWGQRSPKLLSAWGLLLVAYGASLVGAVVAFS